MDEIVGAQGISRWVGFRGRGREGLVERAVKIWHHESAVDLVGGER